MFDRLKTFLGAPELKSSRTAQVLAFASGGWARWTPRDYAALAREGYLANAVVHRAVRLIAENAASCHYLLYEGARELETHPLSQLLARPNPRQDGASLFETLYAHMLLSGNAYVEGVALDENVRELYLLRPDRMKVVPGTDGWAEAYEYSVGGRSVRFDQSASRVPPILHLTFFHPLDDHYGLAPLEAAAVAVDDAIQIAVLDTTLTVPPSSPVNGERHIVANGASGAWAGQGDVVATWETNAWRFLAPKTGWCVWSIADEALLVFDGSAWAPVTTGSSTLDNAPYFCVNATVTGSNLLTVRSNDALLNAIDTTDGGTGDVRLQLSKSAMGNTSSVVFSDAFSGRAEFGLTGDDDFHIKVSADGSTWRDALKFDRTTGRVSFSSGGAREAVTANRTYYVRTDGSDSNDGLSNTSGGAFLTIQKAVDAVAGLDIAGFNVTIQIADGTYTGAVTLKNVVGFSAAGNLVIQGNNTTPANVLVNVSSAYAFLADGISTIWDIKDLKLQNSSGYGISARSGARVRFRNMNFGACTGAAHIQTSGPGSTVTALSNYAVSGGGTAHFEVTYGAQFVSPTFTVTITNTPSFSLAWAFLSVLGSAQVHGMTFSGSATGSRYSINNGSVLFTNGAGTSYLPGNASGTGTNFATSPYGLYV